MYALAADCLQGDSQRSGAGGFGPTALALTLRFYQA
jgi:hypothetical protein